MLSTQTLLIILYCLIGLFFLLLFVRSIILDIRDSTTIQESRLVQMQPDKRYIIIFKVGLFSKRTFIVEPNEAHQTTYVINTFYSGRRDMVIKANINNLTVYSAYLKHVYHIIEKNIE